MSQFYRVLLAEDEERIRRLLGKYFETDFAIVEEAYNGEEALTKALERDYDIILLDWVMPVLSGLEVCQLLKSLKTTPVILLTANGEENNRLRGFEAGADDYVVKPFSPRELMCRIHAILRRTREDLLIPQHMTSGPKKKSPLVIEHHARRVMIHDHEISLTLKEYELIRFFALNEGKTFNREELLREVWKCEPSGDYRTVDSHVKRIREKIHAVSPSASRMIHTIWSIGYRFDPIPAHHIIRARSIDEQSMDLSFE